MAPTVTDTSGPIPDSLLAPLTSHLPYSYSVLRRGQFTHFPQGTTEHAHYLFATDPADQDGDNTALPKHFAAAFVDLSQTPSTEMFFYSTLQDAPDPSSLPEAELEHALDLAIAVFRRVRAIAAACPGGAPAGRPAGVMVGCLHEATYRLLVARRGLASSYHNPHDVWLFRVAELPPPAELAAAGLRWGEVRRADVPLIASRTNLPKVADHLMCEPSVGVRDGEDALVAWAFMGCAGTLSTLHVEVSEESACRGRTARGFVCIDVGCRSRIAGRALRRPLLQGYCGSIALVTTAGVSLGLSC